MSLPDDASNGRNSANALAAGGDPTGVEPFTAAAGGERTAEPAPARSVGSRLLDYSAHAAMIVGLVGFAWTVSNHIVKRPTAAMIEGTTATPAKPDDMAELRHANQQMASDLHQLRASLDALRASARADRTSAEVRILQAGLENVKSNLNAARAETTAAMTQLSGKLDKIEHEPNSKLQAIADRLGRLEKGAVDMSTTASIPPAAAKTAMVVPPVKPSAKAATAEPARKPQDEHHVAAVAEEAPKALVLSTYVVRDVYDGVALIEGRHGPMEVVPGVSIPGAGVVKSINKHGSGWTVTTTKGLLAYAPPPHDDRRAGMHSFPPPYRYDF